MNFAAENLESILLKSEKINDDHLKKAGSVSDEFGKTLGKKLINLGFISEDDLLITISKKFNIPFIKLTEYLKNNTPFVEERLSSKYLKECRIFPISLNDNTLDIAVNDPWDESTFDELKLVLKYDLNISLCNENEILDAVEKHYGGGSSTMQRIVDDVSEDELDMLSKDTDDDIEHLKDMASEAPVIKLVNHIIAIAVDKGVSDIHIEPFDDALKVRYRIDGVLHDVEAPPKKLQSSIISRVKIMAKLNIAEKRLPQDGRIKLRIQGKEIDMRISSLPTLFGESVVMRILDRGNIIINLETLGFPELELNRMKDLIQRPYGMLLVTGPTGSGKTTTLYSALNIINTSDKKIITIEDPVEYQLNGVNQIHVQSKIGLTFSKGLRSIVRQDPDVIMVGEIRDPETADVAIQSALTGHMVFSTVHTNDAAGAVTRLLDMGVENYLISSAVVGVLAQRLVRVICKDCKVPFEEDRETLFRMGVTDRNVIPYRGKGCESCSFTGYKGRNGIFELLVVNETIRNLILEKTSSSVIRETARKQGMVTLREDGLSKIINGITSVSEVLRVTLEENN